MYELPNGQAFRTFLSSNDLTGDSDLSLLDPQGNAITLAIGDRPIITDIVLNNGGTASVITIYQDLNGGSSLDSGEELYAASVGANGQNVATNLSTPIHAKQLTAANQKLRVHASAASTGTKIIILGIIVKT